MNENRIDCGAILGIITFFFPPAEKLAYIKFHSITFIYCTECCHARVYSSNFTPQAYSPFLLQLVGRAVMSLNGELRVVSRRCHVPGCGATSSSKYGGLTLVSLRSIHTFHFSVFPVKFLVDN